MKSISLDSPLVQYKISRLDSRKNFRNEFYWAVFELYYLKSFAEVIELLMKRVSPIWRTFAKSSDALKNPVTRRRRESRVSLDLWTSRLNCERMVEEFLIDSFWNYCIGYSKILYILYHLFTFVYGKEIGQAQFLTRNFQAGNKLNISRRYNVCS